MQPASSTATQAVAHPNDDKIAVALDFRFVSMQAGYHGGGSITAHNKLPTPAGSRGTDKPLGTSNR